MEKFFVFITFYRESCAKNASNVYMLQLYKFHKTSGLHTWHTTAF